MRTMPESRLKLTVDDYELFPDDGRRHELVDGRRTDESLKRRAYERFGVAELWVVDPELEVVRIYRREGDGFARPLELAAERGDAVETPLLPGLRLEVAALFAEG